MDLILASFALGCAFGVAARASRFCLLRGLIQAMAPRPSFDSDGHESQQPGRRPAPALQAFALALAVALIGTQVLAATGQIALQEALPMRAQFSPLGVLSGGLLFGAGMAMADSCGARALVLLAGGNLRSLWALLWLGLSAQAAMTGVLTPARQFLQGWQPVSLSQPSVSGWLAAQGVPAELAVLSAVGMPALLLLIYALRRPALRQRPVQWIGAVVIGLLVVAGWWVSAHIGVDPFAFEPRPLTSLSFISPVAESWLYLQLAVGREFGAIVAMVGGVLAGAFVVAMLTRSFRWEGFESVGRMASSAAGGVLMGFGGVVAMGCSIGQNLSGLSTLALASMPAAAGILMGAAAVIQWRRA
ncbi:MAG: YeeE/YedE family protein [Lautropia sp.]|nr:YeeE/YedE family protein [Lautropia sp.]